MKSVFGGLSDEVFQHIPQIFITDLSAQLLAWIEGVLSADNVNIIQISGFIRNAYSIVSELKARGWKVAIPFARTRCRTDFIARIKFRSQSNCQGIRINTIESNFVKGQNHLFVSHHRYAAASIDRS